PARIDIDLSTVSASAQFRPPPQQSIESLDLSGLSEQDAVEVEPLEYADEIDRPEAQRSAPASPTMRFDQQQTSPKIEPQPEESAPTDAAESASTTQEPKGRGKRSRKAVKPRGSRKTKVEATAENAEVLESTEPTPESALDAPIDQAGFEAALPAPVSDE